MRKIIQYSLVSAEGIMLVDPFPFGDYLDDASLRDRLGLFAACDAMLLGRTTYEGLADRRYCEVRPYLSRLGAMRKYVFSSKLQTADWNNSTLVRGDVVAEVTRLKQQDGGDLLILGNGLLGETLLKEHLLDVLDIAIHPVVVGHGRPLFRDGQAVKLKLTAAKVYSKLVKLTYEPQY
ncbi:MAG: dihydrofolate reductase family protein [Steroidobacteraceae bacterium]